MNSIQWTIPWINNDSISCLEKYAHSLDEVPAYFCNPNDTIGDSLLIQQATVKELHYSQSILKYDNQPDIHTIDLQNNQFSWPFFVIFFSLTLLGLSLLFSFSRFRQAIKAAYSLRETGIFMRNFILNKSASTIITYINTYILLALIVVLFGEMKYGIEPLFLNFVFVFGTLIGYQTVKSILIYISEKLFQTQSESEIYNYRDYFTKIIGSSLALPFVFASFYSPFQVFFLYIAILIFAYSIVHQLVLAVITGYTNSRYSFFYFILYFCSVEILPLLVGAKVLINSGLIIW